MFKKSMVFLFCLTSTIANAAEESFELKKVVACTDTATLLSSISNSKWKERPMWVGKASESSVSLFVNNETKSWTIIQFNNEIGCILEVGTNSQVFFGDPS